jgi:Ni,Fe-hydrogenase III large subunit
MISALAELLADGLRVEAQHPWPRVIVTPEIWKGAAEGLTNGRLTLLGLWSDAAAVHMALLNEKPFDLAVMTLENPVGGYPSIGAVHGPAIRLERAIYDIYGLEPHGLIDKRAWLDHSRWGVRHPLGTRVDAQSDSTQYEFLPAEGEGVHQIAVGPVHAGIIEPGHFRFSVNGETLVRLEQRLGYVHKGIESLMIGAPIGRAAQLAGRASGDSTVAYALAFAQAVEAALDIKVPPRGLYLRALMAELERLANHFGDFGAVCNDAAFSMMLAQCGILREQTLRVSGDVFGHRLMMDRIPPGGISVDVDSNGLTRIRDLLVELRRPFPKLVDLYDNTASLQDRTVTAGIVKPELARQFGAGGFVGRASGRSFDARRSVGYPPYGELKFEVPVLEEGDVNARVWIRIREIEQSFALIEQLLERLPEGPTSTGFDARDATDTREGLSLVEGFRGDILVWVRLDTTGRIARCHLRDPSWFQWPLLEAAIEGNIVADFPLCNKSFNCSYSGHDL